MTVRSRSRRLQDKTVNPGPDTTTAALKVEPWLFLTATEPDRCPCGMGGARRVLLSGASAFSLRSQGALQYCSRTSVRYVWEVRVLLVDRESP